ncbi:MAG: hypothetical protein JWQ95_6998 [Sphaerisporangium sp.]|jgi:hypothetical protein|nr:hypothetical protein [Sphaerisporangium sp.]
MWRPGWSVMRDISADGAGYPPGRADAGESHHSGTKVAESGIYKCEGAGTSGDGRQEERLPPLPKGCEGGGWRLATKTPRSGEEADGS